MKILITLFLVPLFVLSQPVDKVDHDLAWTDIRQEYKAFDEIKPVLINKTEQSIYLSRIWPHGYAQLKRFDDSSGKWELGEWSMGCGTVADAVVPIEMKPQEARAIEVYWKASMDNWDHPRFFVLSDHETKRPLNGRYKLVLRYALQPWTVVHHPKEKYLAESEEFLVNSERDAEQALGADSP